MDTGAIIYYVIKILIIFAQTSELRPSLKDIRVARLEKLLEDFAYYDQVSNRSKRHD